MAEIPTSTLVVYARVIVLTLDIRPTTGDAHQSFADLAASAVLVSSAQRLADAGTVASLVAQAVRVGRADGRASAGDAGSTQGAVPIGLADRTG